MIARGRAAVLAEDSDFKESDHPRQKDGKFGKGSGEAAYVDLSKSLPEASKDEAWVLRRYHDGGGGWENDALRAGGTRDRDVNVRINLLQGFLGRAKIPRNMTVYRGLHGKFGKSLLENLKEGMVIHEKGFLSTSASPSIAKRFQGGMFFKKGYPVLEISVKAGAKGAAIDKWDPFKEKKEATRNQEVLFQSGSKMKVRSWDPKTNVIKVDLEQD